MLWFVCEASAIFVLFCFSSLAKEEEGNTEKMKKTTIKDKVEAFHLRKSLNLLDKLYEEKDLFIQKTR